MFGFGVVLFRRQWQFDMAIVMVEYDIIVFVSDILTFHLSHSIYSITQQTCLCVCVCRRLAHHTF